MLPQRVNGAVHSTSPPQHGSPKPPHAPQPPFEQVPSAPGHAAPEAMQRFVSWLQQPPPLQADPPQHGSPGAPQDAHLPLSPQVRPGPVQKSAALFAPPGQQF